MGKHHHEPFKALGGTEWDDVAAAAGGLGDFLDSTFADALTIVDSIPVPPATAVDAAAAAPENPAGASSSTGRARAHTDSAVRDVDLDGVRKAAASPAPAAMPPTAGESDQQPAKPPRRRPRPTSESLARAEELRKEWKEVKVAAAGTPENPLGINVYKLGAKDGRGSWFARRSVHADMSFDKWRLGLEREFAETMKVQTGPGGGSIRGIGAERVVERHVVDEVGRAEVFQLSAQFPGPTAPRDFITLLLSSDAQSTRADGLREFIVVSKPCVHPECPPRQGFIRGQYESVEMIREVPLAAPEAVRRVRSSGSLGRDSKERSAAAAAATPSLGADGGADAAGTGRAPVAIEWIMVTRSDPGGSVPRFMIERGTPGAIVTDAGKFAKWLASKAAHEEDKEGRRLSRSSLSRQRSGQPRPAAVPGAIREGEGGAHGQDSGAQDVAKNDDGGDHDYIDDSDDDSDASSLRSQHVPSSNGLYGMIASAIGAAGSAVTSRLPNPFAATSSLSEDKASASEGDDGDDDDAGGLSDTSSLSFASALETSQLEADSPPSLASQRSDSSSLTPHATSVLSVNGSDEIGVPAAAAASASSQSPALRSSHADRELRKLEEKRAKLNERIKRSQERMASKQHEDRDKEAAALARLREKHERDLAKHEEKYRREMDRLERKRQADERKAEERRRKTTEREERSKLAVEMDKLTAERDLARRQAEMLREQVGQLQRENTMLVAELGRAGLRPRPLQSATGPARAESVHAPRQPRGSTSSLGSEVSAEKGAAPSVVSTGAGAGNSVPPPPPPASRTATATSLPQERTGGK
jgi:hypothetical protein